MKHMYQKELNETPDYGFIATIRKNRGQVETSVDLSKEENDLIVFTSKY